MPPDQDSATPILALDVDGVISLFGFEEGPQGPPGRFHLFDGMPHCLSNSAGDLLRRLLPYFELVWASGWEHRANEHLSPLLGLPELPVISFGPNARFGTAHWKLGPLERHAGGRPLAWIDDSLDSECRAWARQRTAPTLLVATESARGIEEGHVETILAWASGGYNPR
jgi:hypothetical protein